MLFVRIFLVLPLLLLLGGWLIFSVAQAIWMGEANAAGSRVRFRKQRVFFILILLIQTGFGALMLWQAGLILLALVHGNQ